MSPMREDGARVVAIREQEDRLAVPFDVLLKERALAEAQIASCPFEVVRTL